MDRKHVLKISSGDESIVRVWITDAQTSFIKKYLTDSTRGVPLDFCPIAIKECVCSYFGADAALLPSRIRLAGIVRARQMCFYFYVKNLGYSTERAGKIFNRDHATVIHAMKVVDAKYRTQFAEISVLLKEKYGLPVMEVKNEQQHTEIIPENTTA